MLFFRKKGGLSKFTNSSDSNLFRGSNLRQYPTKSLFRGDFYMMIKRCLGVYFKTVVRTCVHLHV